MIIIPAIVSNGTKIPERGLTPQELTATQGLKVYSNTENYYYFENIEEQETFLGALPQPEINEPRVDLIKIIQDASPEELQEIAETLKPYII